MRKFNIATRNVKENIRVTFAGAEKKIKLCKMIQEGNLFQICLRFVSIYVNDKPEFYRPIILYYTARTKKPLTGNT